MQSKISLVETYSNFNYEYNIHNQMVATFHKYKTNFFPHYSWNINFFVSTHQTTCHLYKHTSIIMNPQMKKSYKLTLTLCKFTTYKNNLKIDQFPSGNLWQSASVGDGGWGGGHGAGRALRDGACYAWAPHQAPSNSGGSLYEQVMLLVPVLCPHRGLLQQGRHLFSMLRRCCHCF